MFDIASAIISIRRGSLSRFFLIADLFCISSGTCCNDLLLVGKCGVEEEGVSESGTVESMLPVGAGEVSISCSCGMLRVIPAINEVQRNNATRLWVVNEEEDSALCTLLGNAEMAHRREDPV